jgi:hypothetical protein
VNLTYNEGNDLIVGSRNRTARRTSGRNETYRLGPHTELLHNAESVQPYLDGWWLNGPTEQHFNRGHRRIAEDQARRLLDTARQLRTLETL